MMVEFINPICDENIHTKIQQKILTREYESISQFRQDLVNLNLFIAYLAADLDDLTNRFIKAKNQMVGTHNTYATREIRMRACERMIPVYDEAISEAKATIKKIADLRDELSYISDMEDLHAHKLF